MKYNHANEWCNNEFWLVGSDQQMQRLEETELKKADSTVAVNCFIFSYISSGMAWLPLKMLHVRLTSVPTEVTKFSYFALNIVKWSAAKYLPLIVNLVSLIVHI